MWWFHDCWWSRNLTSATSVFWMRPEFDSLFRINSILKDLPAEWRHPFAIHWSAPELAVIVEADWSTMLLRQVKNILFWVTIMMIINEAFVHARQARYSAIRYVSLFSIQQGAWASNRCDANQNDDVPIAFVGQRRADEYIYYIYISGQVISILQFPGDFNYTIINRAGRCVISIHANWLIIMLMQCDCFLRWSKYPEQSNKHFVEFCWDVYKHSKSNQQRTTSNFNEFKQNAQCINGTSQNRPEIE